MGRTRQGNRLGRACVKEERSAALSTEFGMKMLRQKWPTQADRILEELGTYTRGPRKGLPRGYVHWIKVIEGGWDYSMHAVRRPGTSEWCVRADANTFSKIMNHYQ